MQNYITGVITPEILQDGEKNTDLKKEISLCGALEIRYDLFGEVKEWPEIAGRVRALHREAPLIATIRLQCDGGELPDGHRFGRDEYWRNILAADIAPQWIDLEWESIDSLSDLRWMTDGSDVQILISSHNFQSLSTDELFEQQLDFARMTKVPGLKFAWTAQNEADLETLEKRRLQLAQTEAKMTTAFSMGELGKNSRLNCLTSGFSYATLGGQSVAPGQLSAQEMHDYLALKG
jgi:3-dehydroquinate dehydratase type I